MTCIFLAGKTENSFVNIQELFKICDKFSESDILASEITLLEVLLIHLCVSFHLFMVANRLFVFSCAYTLCRN
jgi:hypothetical protein